VKHKRKHCGYAAVPQR